jgi:hypothetical protein
MKRYFFGFLLASYSLLNCYSQDDLRSKESFKHFASAQQEQLTDYNVMHAIFSSTPLSFDRFLTAIRVDIIRCKRYIRKNTDISEQQKILLQQLNSFFRYVKKHKHCYNAMNFHNELRQRYVLAFNNQNIVQCIHLTPSSYGLSARCKNKCKTYFNQILIDLAKISKFEDYLHGDYSELKAHNYVFKIELIKIRNSIYHNNVYKYETSYF